MRLRKFLFAGLIVVGAVVVLVGGATIWIIDLGPRMEHQLAECSSNSLQPDAQIMDCMAPHGWVFNRMIGSCDNGEARDVGCYETGLPWPGI